jgi:hypothetical protein
MSDIKLSKAQSKIMDDLQAGGQLVLADADDIATERALDTSALAEARRVTEVAPNVVVVHPDGLGDFLAEVSRNAGDSEAS